MIPEPLRGELRDIEIATNRAIRTARIGTYTSRARGPGMDFDQHVPYLPGDDVRMIDWNVTARLNAPFRRQTHAERELDLVLVLDVSRSMALGAARRTKAEALMLVAAAVLFSAARDQINCGVLTFADDVRTWSPPRRARGRAWHLLEDVWAQQHEPLRRWRGRAQSTRVRTAVSHLLSTLKTTSVAVIVSDFWSDEDLFDGNELRTCAVRHDVVCVVVEDPTEQALPAGHGFLRTKDVESRHHMTVVLNPRTRRLYGAALAAERQRLVDGWYRLGIDYAFVRTDRPIVGPVVELFAQRVRV